MSQANFDFLLKRLVAGAFHPDGVRSCFERQAARSLRRDFERDVIDPAIDFRAEIRVDADIQSRAKGLWAVVGFIICPRRCVARILLGGGCRSGFVVRR